MWSKKKPEPTRSSPTDYDFAQMVKNARDVEPTRFKKVQEQFKHLIHPPQKHQDKKH